MNRNQFELLAHALEFTAQGILSADEMAGEFRDADMDPPSSVKQRAEFLKTLAAGVRLAAKCDPIIGGLEAGSFGIYLPDNYVQVVDVYESGQNPQAFRNEIWEKMDPTP